MHALTRNVAKAAVDHALAFQPVFARKGCTFNHHREMRFAAAIIAAVAAVLRAVILHGQPGGLEGGLEQIFHFCLQGAAHKYSFKGLAFAALITILKRMYRQKFHGRIADSTLGCERPGCPEAGEFRAPGERGPNADGPGVFRWFCLEHVREFNAGYNWFAGMSAEEIIAAQHPTAGWQSETRAFRPDAGIDDAPRWADFSDPLDAINARASSARRRAQSAYDRQAESYEARARFTGPERDALEMMGLSADTNLSELRRRYSEMVRRYHPDRNGGDRSQEGKLQRVVEAYQVLRKATAFT